MIPRLGLCGVSETRFRLRATDVPCFAPALGGTLADGSGTALPDRLDQLSVELGFTRYTDGSLGTFDLFCITAALMVGTAGLPHVIVRFYTVPRVAAVRISAGWALVSIAVLYTTAPAIAAFVRTNPLETVPNHRYTEMPDWFTRWEDTDLIAWIDKNDDGVITYTAGRAFYGKPQFAMPPEAADGRGSYGERLLANTPTDGANELYIDCDIMVLANPQISKLPNWVAGLVAAGGLAAALSTAAGLLLVISTSVAHDLLKKTFRPQITERGELLAARVAAGVAVCIAGYFGLNPPDSWCTPPSSGPSDETALAENLGHWSRWLRARTRRGREGFATSPRLTRDPEHGIDDLVNVHECRKRRPPAGALIAERQETGVVGLVGVEDRVRVKDAELVAKPVDLVVLPRQVDPARPRPEVGGVRLEHLRRVDLRVQGDRQNGDVGSDTVAQEFLYLHERAGGRRALAGALGVHEVDHDDPVLDEVVVEVDRVTVLRVEPDVGKVASHLLPGQAGVRALAALAVGPRLGEPAGRALGVPPGPCAPGHQQRRYAEHERPANSRVTVGIIRAH